MQTVGVVAPDDCSFRRRAHEIRNLAKLGRLGDGVGMSSQRRLSARRRLAEVGRSVERGPRSFHPARGIVLIADLPPRNGYLVHPLKVVIRDPFPASVRRPALISTPLLLGRQALPAKRLVSAASASVLAQHPQIRDPTASDRQAHVLVRSLLPSTLFRNIANSHEAVNAVTARSVAVPPARKARKTKSPEITQSFSCARRGTRTPMAVNR